jgi:uncharacterized protein (DUF1684 family)
LEDTYTGQVYNIEDGIPLSFTMSDTTYAPRFVMHLGKNYNHTITEPLCAGELGSVQVFIDSSETGFFEISGINYFQSGSIFWRFCTR